MPLFSDREPAASARQPGWSVPYGRLALLFGIMAVAYGLLSLVNHYLFRTYAYDLGLFNHALYDYAHGRWNANSVKRFDNILGDHFTVLQIGFAPLWWVFGSWTLLVVQIGAVLFGGWGAWRLHAARAQAVGAGSALPWWLTLHYFSIWGIWTALAYDYHDNVVGAMLLPWLLLAFYEKRGGRVVLTSILLLLSKENMALWLVCVGLGLAWLYHADARRRTWAVGLAGAGALYFKVVTGVVMPALSPTGTYLYTQQYAGLGQSFGEIARNLLQHPGFAISLLWRNFPYQPGADGIKAELHLLVLLSGGLALVRRPAYALMLASIYAQKFLSSRAVLWGISYQYSIEFVPVLNAAVGHWLLARPASPVVARRLTLVAAGLAIVAFVSTQVVIKHARSPSPEPAQARWLSPRHFQPAFDAGAVRRALAVVPPEVPVSAQSVLVAHLADRPTCYLYPFVGEAEYLVLLPGQDPYPLTRLSYDRTLARLRHSGAWVEVPQAAAPTLVVLRRRHPVLAPPYPRRRYGAGPVPLADSVHLPELTEAAFRNGL